MKKVIMFCLLIGGLVLTSCNKPDSAYDPLLSGGVNETIHNLVQKLEPTAVDEYLYKSQTVYLFDTWRGPDDFTYLYSEKGEVMAAFGGFTGHGDGRCTDFHEAATFVRTVYSKGRWLTK